MKLDHRTLWLFADGMASCLAAGLPPQRALELSRAGMQGKGLTELIRAARQRCEQGMSLAEALEPGEKLLPHYFLPVIRAGESAGRLVEAFQLLSQHCRRIAPSVRLVRNTWLYPLVCVVSGWIVRIGIFLYFGKTAAAVHFFWFSFGTTSLLVVAGWLLMKLRPVRAVVDSLLLQMPIVRQAELGLSLALFFATFRLVYEAGGLGVLVMFDLACRTVRNSAVRVDLRKARRSLEKNETFGDAFERLSLLENPLKGLIATGSISGQLDKSLDQLVSLMTQQLELTLQSFNNVFQRLVSLSVALSIAETVAICVM